MSAWECRGCTAVYSVGAPRCPQCGTNDPIKEGEQMAKITVAGGPSDATLEEVVPAESGETTGGPLQPLPDVTDDPTLANEEKAAEPDYEKWTVEQLKDQLAERGITKSGKHDELVQRLLEDNERRAKAERDAR